MLTITDEVEPIGVANYTTTKKLLLYTVVKISTI